MVAATPLARYLSDQPTVAALQDLPNYQDFVSLNKPNVAGLTYGDSPFFQEGLVKASQASPLAMGIAGVVGSIQGNPVAAPVGGGFYAPSVEQAVTNAYGGPMMPETVREDLIQSEFVTPFGHEISHLGMNTPQLNNFISGLSYGNLTAPLMGTKPGTILAGSEELPNYINDAIYGPVKISENLIKSGFAKEEGDDVRFTSDAFEAMNQFNFSPQQLKALGFGGINPYASPAMGAIHASSPYLKDIQSGIVSAIQAQEGLTNYKKLQNELKQKQMQAQKKSLEDRFKNINVENVKKMTNYVTGQQLHGNLKGPKSDQKGKKGGINRKDPKGGIGGGLGGIHK